MITDVSASTHLRQRLRQETDDIHQLLHHNPGMQRLVSEDCTRDDYLAVLQVFFRFYQQAEQQIDSLFATTPAVRRFAHEARPLEWLRKDFAVANIEPVDAGENGWLKFTGSPTLEQYIGYLYVKQGSTLGGQGISKCLQKSLALQPGESQFFFHGFGGETGHNWKAFLNYLSHEEHHLLADAVILSARNHFLTLHSLFNQAFPKGGDNGY